MPAAAVSGNFYFPQVFPTGGTGIPGFTGALIDSANESAAMIIQIRKTGTISKVGFRTSAVNTGGNVDVRLETVTNGDPSGTLYQSSSNIVIPIADTDDNIWVTASLGSGTVVQAGSILAVRIQMNATSAGRLNISTHGSNDPSLRSNFPYTDLFQGSVWTQQQGVMPIGLEYSDGTYPFNDGCYPIQNFSTITYTTASAIDERGIAFSFPFPCTAIGFWGHLDSDVACSAILYAADTTTVLATMKIDSNNRVSAAQDRLQYSFASTVTFLAASTYRLTFVPDPGGTIALTEWIGSSTAVMPQFDGYPRVIETTRADSGTQGNWVEDARVYPLCGLILNAFDDGTGSGTTTVTQAAGVWGF